MVESTRRLKIEMADKITELIDKALKPVMTFIGKNKLNKENITGIVLGDTDIQLCYLEKKKGSYHLKEYSYQKIAGIGQDQDIFTASTYLSDQIKNSLSSIKLKSKDVSVSLPNSIVTTYNLQIPIMDELDLKESVDVGGFWEQFDQTPETLEGFETSYKVLGSNEEMGIMDILLFTAETKTIEAYMNIFRLAGVNPVVLDINSNNQFNALVPAFGEEGFESPVAILNYQKENSYVAVASSKGVTLMELSIVEADQVLLDTVEDVADVLNEFWDEIFERIGSQIKQALVEFETRFETEPIALVNLFTDKGRVKNFSAGLAKHLGEELVLKEYDPAESIEVDDDSKKYIDSLPNVSMSAAAIGSALRKLNSFEIQNATDEIFKFNFVPKIQQLKINRKSTAAGKFFMTIGIVILLSGLGHVVPFNILKILENEDTISKNSSELQDVEQKRNMLQVYDGKIAKVQGDTNQLKKVLGENKKTTTDLVSNLIKIIPENIRISQLEIKDKHTVIIDGVSKDDQSVSKMVELFTQEASVDEANLDNFSNFMEADKAKIYAVGRGTNLKPEEIPKENISKKFTLSISLKPLEGEIFDNEKKLTKLLKAGAKRKFK